MGSRIADTAAMFSNRVVRLDLAPGAADGPPAAPQGQEQQKPTSLYKVITNLTALQTTPNCKLILKEGMPLGEHCLAVKSTKQLKEGKQWLLNYGVHHQCGERAMRKRVGAGAGGQAKRQKGDGGGGNSVGNDL